MSDLLSSQPRHPDLEIYIKSRSGEEVINWLQTICKEVTELSCTDHSNELRVIFSDGYVDCSLQQKVSGKAWSSLWFKNNETPWATDLDCALQASKQMGTQIRCIKASWSDTEDKENEEDQWWRVEDNTQELISWKS
ncbi:MAG: hypothetical protein V7784_14715 [Oceanospirillaceae bacterium]